MKVLSFNLWSDAPRNKSWVRRRDAIAGVFKQNEPELCGLQEATLPMIRDLNERLPQYGWIGHGRDDGGELGEHTPIFYRSDRFSLLEGGSFWLARVCDQPGRGWDAFCSRTVTWARLDESTNNRQVVHFNTHFDHLGRTARVQSALLLLRKIEEIAGAAPVIVTGDLNCRESSAPYRLLTGQLPFSDGTSDENALRDTLYDTEQPPEGPRKTFRGLLGSFGLGRIDYIFVNSGLRTRRHEVLDEAIGASDHRPVLAELRFAARPE
jgi:endonuclease/exonuclease/phosphatase family metal-dependent hydrolase